MTAGSSPQPRMPGLVDIVVPTNRVGPFLSTALDSVRTQQYRPWRLLIVDDGSSAPAELDRLASKLPSATVIHRPPAGVSAARNVAIRSGRGEFVAFLDDDDTWPPGRLSDLVATLREHPAAAGAFGNGRYIDALGRVTGQWTTTPASPADYLSGSKPLPRITTLLVRRTTLDRVGLFDERLKIAEDNELILRILRDAPLASSMTTVVDYRRHENNITLGGWRVHHRAGRAAVMANIEAAERLGNHEQVALLRMNLRRVGAANAGDSFGRVIGDLRARRFRSAALDVRDSIRIAPLAFLRGTLQTVGSRIHSRAIRRRA